MPIFASFTEPKSANGLDMEWDITRARGRAGELEARYTVFVEQYSTKVNIEYIDSEEVETEGVESLKHLDAVLAVRIGTTRLIDNHDLSKEFPG